VKTIFQIQKIYEPENIIFFFDKGKDDSRINICPGYKANRETIPDAVKIQIPIIQDFISSLGYENIVRTGCEADDLIGTFAKKYKNQFDEIIIFSKDKDFSQCVSGNVKQLIPESGNIDLGRIVDRDGVHEKFGIYPEQIVDFLSLIGDSADNIHGIYGVGPKTAVKWLQKFGSINNIFNSHLQEITPVRFQTVLQENLDLLNRNKQIITIKTDIEDIYYPETRDPNLDKFENLIQKYKLFSLKRYLPDAYKKTDAQLELF
jgi:DNA polymerase-1